MANAVPGLAVESITLSRPYSGLDHCVKQWTANQAIQLMKMLIDDILVLGDGAG